MPKPLKIIIFDGSFKTTPFINRLLKGLASQHEVFVLGFNEQLDRKIAGICYVPLGSNQNKWRFFVTTLDFCWRHRGKGLFFSSLYKLLRGERVALQQQNVELAVQHINPDVIHLQWPSVIPWFENILEAQQYPVILSQRGYHNNVRPFVNHDNFNYLKSWYPKLSGFHSVSKALAKKGDAIYAAPEKINHVVYTGIDFDKLLFDKAYVPNKKLQLISVGRAHWIKGYNDAVRCCAVLKQARLDFNYTIIGGAGDEELQFLIHELGLQDHVNLTGRIAQQLVFEQMKNADVLLLPSLEEGIANVVVEAMALGTPVISTNCGGMEELISDGENGWIVPTRNPKALADAIVAFSQLPTETIEKVRVAARKKVVDQHSESQMVAGMAALYQEILAQAGIS